MKLNFKSKFHKVNSNFILYRSFATLIAVLLYPFLILIAYLGQHIGLILLIVSIVFDVVLPIRKLPVINTVSKSFLMIQAILLWMYAATPYVAQTRSESGQKNIRIEPKIELRQYQNNNSKNLNTFQNEHSSLNFTNPQPIPLFLPDTFKVLTKEQARKQTHYSLLRVFGNDENMPQPVDAPDLKYRSPQEVRSALKTVFDELPPADQLLSNYRNPCWVRTDKQEILACLPLVYVLGQPKCGTTDLYLKLKEHPSIAAPPNKEIRWFTRGEFMDKPMLPETFTSGPGDENFEYKLSAESSIYSFTRHFNSVTNKISSSPKDVIAIDGGPHTFWWPIQQPEGSVDEKDIPAPQILREIQPNARFIVTLADPVRRHYSDYYFLNDDRSTYFRNNPNDYRLRKSPQQFHARTKETIKAFKNCVDKTTEELRRKGYKQARQIAFDGIRFRAAQICAHDRKTFGKAGWGRLSIGLYVLYLHKWLEHFPLNQFLVVRLEDYDVDPKAYLRRIFRFLELREPNESEWSQILSTSRSNQYNQRREPMLPETEDTLREFYSQYNDLLAFILDHPKFTWRDVPRYASTTNSNPSLDFKNTSTFLRQIYSDTTKKKSLMSGLFSWKKEEETKVPQQTYTFNGKIDNPLTVVDKPGIWHPFNFSTAGLSSSDSRYVRKWLTTKIKLSNPPKTIAEAATQLHAAICGLDITALRYLLYKVGVPATLNLYNDDNRPPLVSLAMSVLLISDAHSNSQVFSLHKGHITWVNSFSDPPLPRQQDSVHTKDIVDSIQKTVVKVAQWLLRAGADIHARDNKGYSVVDYASMYGSLGLLQEILQYGFDVNAQVRKDRRTPLHLALAYGQIDIARELLNYGANIYLFDKWNVSAYDILKSPGTVSAEDALKIFSIHQRSVRTIDRVIHPELLPNVEDPRIIARVEGEKASTEELRKYFQSWPGGTGGWDTQRLKGYENEMHCDVDQYWADEITGKEIFDKYIAQNKPVLIRGLLHLWHDAILNYSHYHLRANHGTFRVEVSPIPYTSKFGLNIRKWMNLSEYIDQVRSHKIIGEPNPWYIFRGFQISNGEADAANSLVPLSTCPTPKAIQDAFKEVSRAGAFLREQRFDANENEGGLHSIYDTDIHVKNDFLSTRQIFVSAQWAFGGEGTGAPVHFHMAAWNAIIYGAKKWILYPPTNQIMSIRQIKYFIETDMVDFQKRSGHRGFAPKTCVQTAGDIMIVPEAWGHGVLNIQESVAVATEGNENMWRVSPGHILSQFLEPAFPDGPNAISAK